MSVNDESKNIICDNMTIRNRLTVRGTLGSIMKLPNMNVATYDRFPNENDDASTGHVVGEFWLDQGKLPSLYINIDNTVGAAIWQYIRVSY